MSDDAESGELPIQHSPFDLRVIGRRSLRLPFYVPVKRIFLCKSILILHKTRNLLIESVVVVNIPFGIISMAFVMSVNIFIGKCRACIYSSSS